jgi:hypothetical protein
VGHFQSAALLVPSGAIQHNDGMGAGCDLRADFRKVQAHCVGIDMRQNQRRANAPVRTDGTEDVGPLVSLITRLAGTAARLRPDIGQAALPADDRFVLPPEFDRLAASVGGNGSPNQVGKVFLCAACASASCAGWRGRTET